MAEVGVDGELTERQRYWLDHISGWKKFGGPMKAYAMAHGLDVREFDYWKRYLDEKGMLNQVATDDASTFHRLVVEQTSAPVCRVEFPNGVRVELTGPLSSATLGMVFKAAGALS